MYAYIKVCVYDKTSKFEVLIKNDFFPLNLHPLKYYQQKIIAHQNGFSSNPIDGKLQNIILPSASASLCWQDINLRVQNAFLQNIYHLLAKM